jgi:predicted DNA-binding transcriptional regulator YafY
MKRAAKTGSALLRQWHMLLALPRYPRKTTAREIRDRLAAQQFETTTRTVQRDLLELARVFPIAYDGRSKPYGWSWAKDAAGLQLPSLSVAEALTMQMVERYLRGLLPSSTLQVLEPHFRAAAARIAAVTGRRRHHWLERVRIVPAAQQLLPPKVRPAVQATVFEAILDRRRLRLRYLRRGEAHPVEFEANPLAIVQRGPVTYIVATLFQYRGPRLLALHRIESAVVLEGRAVDPPDFDLDEFIREGHLAFGDGSVIRLKLRFYNGAGDHLAETPLSEDQVIRDRGGGVLEVEATVAHTPQLEWWLRGFGENLQVLRPRRLGRKAGHRL